MNNEKLYNAITHIDEDLLDLSNNSITETRPDFSVEADNHKTKKIFQWKKWAVVAACFVLLLGVLIPLNENENKLVSSTNSPFVITVYAAESSNDINLKKINSKLSVPISFFETKSGIKGFVFSYGNEVKDAASTFAVYNNNNEITVEPNIEELASFTASNGQHYIFYIPANDEKAPYNITIRLVNEGVGYAVDILVEENNKKLVASLSKLTSYPIMDSEINVNENGQTYGKDVYSNDTNEEPDLIYAEAVDGTKGYVYATDLYSDKKNSPEQLLEQDKIYQDVWEKAPDGTLVIARYIPLYDSDGKNVVGQFPITIGYKEKGAAYPGLR